jgi:hypothetical protein
MTIAVMACPAAETGMAKGAGINYDRLEGLVREPQCAPVYETAAFNAECGKTRYLHDATQPARGHSRSEKRPRGYS